MAKKIDLSVIILSYNTKDLLQQCLKSVEKAVRSASSYQTEVIVVDNASRDNSPQVIRKEFPEVKLIVSRKNLGFSGGNNLGIKKASGRYFLFLNSDTEVYPQAFSKVIKLMNRRPQVGALSVKTILASGEMDPDCHRGFPTPWASITYFLGLERLFPRSRIFGQYHQLYCNLDRIHEIDAGAGAFMVVRQEVIKKVGAWDESYFFYGEDLDFFYRIKQAGGKVVFYPKPLLKHYKGASSGLRPESRGLTRATRTTRIEVARASIKAMEIFYRKFYQDKYPRWLTKAVLLGIKIKSWQRLFKQYLKT